MKIRDVMTPNPKTVSPNDTIQTAARVMQAEDTGAVPVVNNGQVLAVVTDRDIVIEIVGAGLSPETVKVGEILQRPVVTVQQDAGYAEAVRSMSVNGVRRMPVVDASGALVGIITIDDILHQLAGPLLALGELAGRERHYETESRS